MNGKEIDESHENFNANNTLITIVRSDSLIDINSYNIQTQMDNVRFVAVTVASIIQRQHIIEEFTLNEDQLRSSLHAILIEIDF